MKIGASTSSINVRWGRLTNDTSFVMATHSVGLKDYVLYPVDTCKSCTVVSRANSYIYSKMNLRMNQRACKKRYFTDSTDEQSGLLHNSAPVFSLIITGRTSAKYVWLTYFAFFSFYVVCFSFCLFCFFLAGMTGARCSNIFLYQKH